MNAGVKCDGFVCLLIMCFCLYLCLFVCLDDCGELEDLA